MSDHSISCTIANEMTSGALQKSGDDLDSGTTLSMADGAEYIDSGVTVEKAFTASHALLSGCGGTVTYLLPNKSDVLVIAFNTSVNDISSYCIPLLQSGPTSNVLACNSYYCTTSNAVSTSTSNGLVTTISVYDRPSGT